jgi:hypothetical protein
MSNTKNDFVKKLKATEAYLKAITGFDQLEQMSAEDLIPFLAQNLCGVNGGLTLDIDEASEVVGFNRDHHVIRTGEDTWSVLALIEFDDSEEAFAEIIERGGYRLMEPMLH